MNIDLSTSHSTTVESHKSYFEKVEIKLKLPTTQWTTAKSAQSIF